MVNTVGKSHCSSDPAGAGKPLAPVFEYAGRSVNNMTGLRSTPPSPVINRRVELRPLVAFTIALCLSTRVLLASANSSHVNISNATGSSLPEPDSVGGNNEQWWYCFPAIVSLLLLGGCIAEWYRVCQQERRQEQQQDEMENTQVMTIQERERLFGEWI